MLSIVKYDQTIILWINSHLSSLYVQYPFMVVTIFGKLGLLCIFLILYLFATRRNKIVLLKAILAYLLTAVIVGIFLKEMVSRPRPFIELQNLLMVVRLPEGFSFPSGHAAFSGVGFYLAFRYLKGDILYWISMFSFILIAFSRCILKVHYPTDVLSGFIIGLVITWLVDKAIKDKKSLTNN